MALVPNVRVSVYDITGKLAKNLFFGENGEGEPQIFWDKTDHFGKKVSSGIYFITVDKGNSSERFKAMIIQ